MLAATLSCGKWILSFLPNVEIVTLLCGLYGYVFGPVGVASAVVFVCIEPLLYGFGLWTISYFLYWPLVAAAFWLLDKLGVKSRMAITAIAIGLTLWFGVLTSLVDTGLFTGVYQRFWERFAILYVRGIGFYLAMLACNAVTFPLLFSPLAQRLKKMLKRGR